MRSITRTPDDDRAAPPARRLVTQNLVTLGLLAGAGAITALIIVASPPQREVRSLPAFLVQLVPFLLAAEGIARLTVTGVARVRAARVLVPVSFLVFFCYFIPKGFYLSGDFEAFYVNTLQMVPFVILALSLAYRLGGGSTGTTRRLAVATLLLMLSGLEDLAFLLINDNTGTPYEGIPDVWFWASHIEVFLGHPPSKYEAFAFIAVHVVLAGLVLFAGPRRLTRRGGRAAGSDGAQD